jgi:hypothetical protein
MAARGIFNIASKQSLPKNLSRKKWIRRELALDLNQLDLKDL